MRHIITYRTKTPKTRQVERSDELLELTKENNQMLHWIMSYLMHEDQHDDTQDFIQNVVANLVSNRVDFRRAV